MLKIYSKFLCILILPLFLGGCFSFDEVEIRDINSFNLKNFSDKGMQVDARIKIANPNNFSIKIVRSEFDLHLKGKKIGTASLENKIKIPANSENYHEVKLISDHSDMNLDVLPTLLSMAFSQSGKMDLEIKGFVVCKVFIFRKKIEVDHREMVPVNFFN